jgi:hypothetical protein
MIEDPTFWYRKETLEWNLAMAWIDWSDDERKSARRCLLLELGVLQHYTSTSRPAASVYSRNIGGSYYYYYYDDSRV